MSQFHLADLDLRWTGVDGGTPPGHVIAVGLDPLGNTRTFLWAGDQPDDDQYVGSIIHTATSNIAYGPGAGYVRGGTADQATLLAALVDSYAPTGVCPVCDGVYRTRSDGQIRTHSTSATTDRCNGSPPEEALLDRHPAVGICAVCDRQYHLTKTGKIWTHNNATRDTQSGSYGMRCSGAGQPPKEQ